MTQGSSCFHFSEEHLDMSAALRLRWNRSTIPLPSGLYAVVVVVEMPSRWANCVQRAEVNTDPLSDVILSGRPNLAIQESMRAETQESVEASDIGTASGHLVERSMMVKR